MESPSSAIAAGDGCAAKNQEVTSSIVQKTEVCSLAHTMSNGLHDYRFMKNGKPRPSAVRDFPKNIVPAYRISDAELASSKEKTEAHVLPVPFKDEKELKQIKDDLIISETKKNVESNADIGTGKVEKGPSKELHLGQKPAKASMLSSKKPQAESKKQSLASPDMAKPTKEKDGPTEKTQKTPTKLGKPTDQKVGASASIVSDEPEAEPSKGKGAPAGRTQKIPTKAGKSAEKKATAKASTASDASPREAEAKSNKGKDVVTEKAQRTPIKLGKSVVKKPTGVASTVSDASLRGAEPEPNKEKGVLTEKIQKMPTKLVKAVEKKADDVASAVAEVSLQADEHEVVNTSQGEMEAMEIDKEEDEEKLHIEIEQGNQKEQTMGEKSKKLHPVKRKSVIRDLPEIINPMKEKVGREVVQDNSGQDLDMKEGVQEKAAADNAKQKSIGKKKRPLEEPSPSNRNKKLSKNKSSDIAQTAKESSPGSPAVVVTPKARKANKKPSTPSDSGRKARRSAGKLPKPTIVMDVGESRKSILESLRLFDAVRRKFVQDEEKNGKAARGTRADLQAATLLKDRNVSRGVEKVQGSFPGILVGDMFLFRTELSFARVHGPIQAGIDYLTAKESEYDSPVAISIISNVGQDGEDAGEVLIYTGQGGRGPDNKQIADQKLERGNLALDGSKKHDVPVRVIRGIKDVNSPSAKIYVYDGLYKVKETKTAKGSGGFDEFKFMLQRMEDQPELGSDTLKLATDLKSQAPSSRRDIVIADISKGKESQAICIENTVDDNEGPAPFEYSTKVIYPDDTENLESSVGCNCKGACNPSSSCSCFSKNGDELPYINGGYLVRQKDYIFECGSKCSCSSSCRNRATEKGLKFRLDVFKTVDRGWGVRSLDMIPAGGFVCEYIGKLVADAEEIKAVSDREHLMFTSRLPDMTPRWGDVPSIFPDRSSSTIRPDVGNLELIIDASSIGNVARFINHSCSPNLLIQKVLSEHQDLRYPHFKLFARDNIPPMRELTFDYGHPSDQELVSEQVTIDCLCGSLNCRGKLYL